MGALVKGWVPTCIGYHIQGMAKFGFNEIFKDVYGNMLGEDNAYKFRPLIWAAASATAEFIADIFLCPFEMTKVKVQVSAEGTFPLEFSKAWAEMNKNKAETNFPLGSLKPLWMRQIPYTVVKFVGFEAAVEMFYKHVYTKPKSS